MAQSDDAQPQRPIRYPRARLSPAKDELMILTIPRAEVEAGDIAPVAQQLGFLSESAEMAERWEGRIGFVFDGWEDDARETAEIPAIRAYFGDLAAVWPYWLHFSEKVGDTLPHVLRLCCRGRIEEVGDGPDWVQVPERLTERAQFALRVRGDSMTEDQIEDGDLILIARQTSAANGEIVVALIDGEAATLKRLYHEGATVRLQPANAAMAPLQFPAEAVQLIGVVTGVLRGAAQP
ncbi:LexA family protein [Halochromatium glycolicum]|uniref:Peptidase S24/S26A/S26B/S26C domain-containing protein n=1 Tax=Halochromatium glycolicum TaxID=85075 RepID=A0AAJ0XCG1_9GAMM|nr:S24 family peptidase [Halochromatium glycolicum]MBK1707343.1 hypothetical protein [Halochromatium glycolicum]